MNNEIRIRAGIVGGAGYTGGEMIRILLNHPHVQLSFVHSRSNAGQPLSKVHQDLEGDTDICFSADMQEEVDILFLCVGHGEAKKLLATEKSNPNTRIIDLSQDYRLAATANEDGRTFVYGLPELNAAKITTAQNIANPGCFATAILLGTLPLAQGGLLNELHTTGITGSTGAGQKQQETTHFSWRANNIQAYKSLTHQHINEIGETLRSLQPNHNAVNFIPWRGDFTRGIYVTSYVECDLGLEAAYSLYSNFYSSAVFTHISHDMVHLKQVVNTNKCLLHLEKEGSKLIIHSAIDNLLKGASGQAVQNMNIMFGLSQDSGLKLKAVTF